MLLINIANKKADLDCEMIKLKNNKRLISYHRELHENL